MRKRLPPYVSYSTFQAFLADLNRGVPNRIDRSSLPGRSGGIVTQLVGALRYLDLADNNGTPSNRLRQLASARGPQRGEILKQVATEAYDFLFQGDFNLQAATPDQLDEVFQSTYPLRGDVTRKCVKFFKELANDAGIALSPFLTREPKSSRAPAGARKSSRKIVPKTKKFQQVPETLVEIPIQTPLDRMLMDKFPKFDPSWPDQLKVKWFEDFDQLLKRIFATGNGK
ncbi:MAG: DUF5343 domain-containing protein [Chloroflexi bacterium]|nr:DUF5343 domain-containing protein [Chloroflexota bacterium]